LSVEAGRRWTIQRPGSGARPPVGAGSPATCSRSLIYVFTIPILVFTMTDPAVHVALILAFTFE